MQIESQEVFEKAADEWLELERARNEHLTGEAAAKALTRQIVIEGAMEASPFEFDEEGQVILKPMRIASSPHPTRHQIARSAKEGVIAAFKFADDSRRDTGRP